MEDNSQKVVKRVVVGLIGLWIGIAVFYAHYALTRNTQTNPPAQNTTLQNATKLTPAPTPSPQPTPTPVPSRAPSPKPTATPAPKIATTTPVSRPAYVPAPAKVMAVSPTPAPTPTPTSSPSGGGSGSGTTQWTYGTPYNSDNWSGYVARTGRFTAASGSWVVPNPSASSPEGSGDSAWVGVGGWGADNCIQTGSDDWIQNGQVKREAWYELLPADSVWLPSLTINAGDTMYASVSEISTNYWNILIKDETDGDSYTTNVNYVSDHSSADWIEEDTTGNNNTLETIDNFGSVTFTGGLATVNGVSEIIGATTPSALTMLSDATGRTEEKPTPLNSAGNGFTVNQTY